MLFAHDSVVWRIDLSFSACSTIICTGPDDGGIPEILSTMIARFGVTAILFGVSRVVVGLEVQTNLKNK